MSHYATIPTQFKYLDELVEALEAIYNHVEVHEKPQHLYGYQGDKRKQMAEVIVRRQFISGLSNDLGFKLNERTGCYEMIVSEYDSKQGKVNQQRIITEYVQRVVKNRLPRGKYRVLSTKKNEIRLQVIA